MVSAQRRPRSGAVRQSAQMESSASTARNRLQPTQRPTRVTSATVLLPACVDDEFGQRGPPAVVHACCTRHDERGRGRRARRRARLGDGDELHAISLHEEGRDVDGSDHAARKPNPPSERGRPRCRQRPGRHADRRRAVVRRRLPQRCRRSCVRRCSGRSRRRNGRRG